MLEIILLAVWVLIVPVILAVGSYALSLGVLCLVRLVPVVGRKHRHPHWERLNRRGETDHSLD